MVYRVVCTGIPTMVYRVVCTGRDTHHGVQGSMHRGYPTRIQQGGVYTTRVHREAYIPPGYQGGLPTYNQEGLPTYNQEGLPTLGERLKPLRREGVSLRREA